MKSIKNPLEICDRIMLFIQSNCDRIAFTDEELIVNVRQPAPDEIM
ncbi:hypothetical protein H6F77_07845 [Microcoleus sp. FACHB-831]|nr:hypothetical protein [Microcoleus sp. FACHB-831]MBD1920999.1 hypothetical protein [Microcoleus sp. FACHB-831]